METRNETERPDYISARLWTKLPERGDLRVRLSRIGREEGARALEPHLARILDEEVPGNFRPVWDGRQAVWKVIGSWRAGRPQR